jgi:LmbE family N-acetylglucosaminyl deacetylase
MEPLAGYHFQPQVYVDVTDTFSRKLAMLECHRSQMEFMSRYGGQDFRVYMETVARFRGYQCGAKLAEGFIPHASWGHVSAGPVLP